MDLEELYNLINFYVNKYQGSWYPPEELDLIVDRAQITLFNRYYIEYATSQRLIDALAPFKTDFSYVTPANGIVDMPANYMDLIAVYTFVQDVDNVTRTKPVEMVREDELAIRLTSQVCPVSITAPIGRQLNDNDIKLWPDAVHTAYVIYLRRPAAPHFVYTLVSGRVIVYDEFLSTQLEWPEKDYKSIALIALEELGINMSEQDIIQWGAAKDQQNFTTNMKE